MEKTVSDYFNGEISSQAERKAPQIFFKIAEAEAAFAHSQVGEPGFSNTHEKQASRCVDIKSGGRRTAEGAGQRKAQDSRRRRTAEGAGPLLSHESQCQLRHLDVKNESSCRSKALLRNHNELTDFEKCLS